MRSERVYVYLVERSETEWRTYYLGRELFISEDLSRGYIVTRPDYTPIPGSPFPSLNLAKRVGSKWLRSVGAEKQTPKQRSPI